MSDTEVKCYTSAAPGIFGLDYIASFYSNKGVQKDSFSFIAVQQAQIVKALKNTQISKATGLDAIPARFIRDASDEITPAVTHIINLSLTQGIVPDDFKKARVIPLYKKADKTGPGNYRPVSVLNVMSKILERVVYDQINSYLSENGLLYKYQSGFRNSYSTESCLINLTDYIRTEIDNGKYCGMVLLDLQKAFDTVDHDILLYKLKAMGMSKLCVKWMSSYLVNRKQVVDVHGTVSSFYNVTCGVPQGSILGPLLFLIYVNDMVDAVNCRLILYADDSTLIVSGKSIEDIENSLCAEMNSISKWLIDNKLSLHMGKTESILFGNHHKLSLCNKLKIQCNNIDVVSKTKVKYLGIELDQKLNGEHTANYVISKVSARIKFLYRKAKYIDCQTLKLLASAIVQCHFDYGCCSWYAGLSMKLKNKLQVCQNKLIRVILGLHPRCSITLQHFVTLNWLPVSKRVSFLKLCYVKRILSGLAPSYMSEGFEHPTSIHNIRTRNSQNGLIVPRNRSVFGSNSFKYSAICEWNRLPDVIRQCTTLAHFKKECKSFLFELVSNEVSSDFV